MRYFIGFLVTIGLIILLIVILLQGGSKSKVPSTSKTLESYSTTAATVRLTIDGPVNADQSHEALRITVGQDQTTFDQLQGYQGNVVKSQSYANNETSYNVFLHALDHAGFTQGKAPQKGADVRGYCALGNSYVFELMQNGSDIVRYWATSCGNPKTYAGNLSLTLELFRAQVPDYATLTENVSLAGAY